MRIITTITTVLNDNIYFECNCCYQLFSALENPPSKILVMSNLIITVYTLWLYRIGRFLFFDMALHIFIATHPASMFLFEAYQQLSNLLQTSYALPSIANLHSKTLLSTTFLRLYNRFYNEMKFSNTITSCFFRIHIRSFSGPLL